MQVLTTSLYMQTQLRVDQDWDGDAAIYLYTYIPIYLYTYLPIPTYLPTYHDCACDAASKPDVPASNPNLPASTNPDVPAHEPLAILCSTNPDLPALTNPDVPAYDDDDDDYDDDQDGPK